MVFSTTKGATALCAHILATRGQLDLTAPVARYWPEFAQAGKESVTVGMLLSHRAGLPVITEPLEAGALYDWDRMAGLLAAERPVWEPGTWHGYHAMTFGWLVGEVVRRVSGRSLGTFLREEVAGPLGLDLWLGLPAEHEPRVAAMGYADPRSEDETSRLSTVAAAEPDSVPARMLRNTAGYLLPGPAGFDSRAGHAAELGATGMITNARAVAGMYAPLAAGGGRLVDAKALARMSTTVSAGADATLFANSRFSYGYVRSIDNRHEPYGLRDSMILSADAFGHPGLGGGLGFASPANRMSFGYTMNAMGRAPCSTRAASPWSTPSTAPSATRTTPPRCGGSPPRGSCRGRLRFGRRPAQGGDRQQSAHQHRPRAEQQTRPMHPERVAQPAEHQ